MLSGIHAKRAELEKKPDYIKEVLDNGAKRAQVIASKNMAEIKKAMNVL
jgi:tryptophanyl-tRNA synthetase